MKLAALYLAVITVVAAAPTSLQHPILRAPEGCSAHCTIPDAKETQQLRSVLCSREGQRRLLACATCIDSSPEERAQPAMDEYRRVVEACDAELFNE
ncbi:hypothetical protein CC85DRAFT_303865 [Cutaneotrichosporon oleaginosum]|uniref:Uncharacterized protein n=1 Tax=Cutaneotrichosporon oleaginosum TaxID=879819 RepID=A0A0J0XI42_9TREE|nr:uncharacterized protein CC85DRAFT_303865 [Cutaneotrichosporon oleaginosum]KLT40748.1 hypothetical protein CC85DRAFT_303865 [Cutaneotrichosporon oleaginosum]